MNVVARMLTQEQDGIPGYMAQPEAPGQRPGILMVHHAHGVTADYKIDAYRLACLGFNVLAPDLFNMFGIAGTTHIGMGADLQAKHGDDEFLGKMDEAWRYLIDRLRSDPARTGCIGHCMGGRLLIPFAADHPSVKAIVLYYPSVRDEPETSHRPRHAFHLAKTLQCASLVFAAGQDYIATPAIQGPLWQSFISQRQARGVALLLRRAARLPPPRQPGLPALLRRPHVAAHHQLPAAHRLIERGATDMPEPKQKFSASLAKDAVYQQGLRSFMEYRDLGIADATHGKMRAHIVRVKQGGDTHELHTTGLHKHECDFQMFYVLKGTIKFVYEGQGERTFGPGDCVLQPAGIVHNELECTDDLEILEIYSPAVHPTVVVERMPEVATAH